MRIGVLGINHKIAPVGLREALAQACQRRFLLGGAIQDAHTFVLLTTCNRTEVYFTSHDLTEAHSFLLNFLREEVGEEFDQKLYSFFGQDCFLHLARVTAGLDSAIVAETEIQGQVKGAYEQAASCVDLPGDLHYLFQKALKIGKQVRSKLVMARGIPDLEHAIFNSGVHFFSDPQKASVLFVGASDINRKIISFLKGKNLKKIALCNRSLSRGQTIADQYDLALLDWSERVNWPEYDWIIFGTKAPHHLIGPAQLPECKSRKLIIDLSVPRNVAPQIGRHSQITLLNIDQINRILRVRRKQMTHTIHQAEQLVAGAAQQSISLFHEKERRRRSHLICS